MPPEAFEAEDSPPQTPEQPEEESAEERPSDVTRPRALTKPQVDAILDVLQSFGVDPSVITNVEQALRGRPSSFDTNLRPGDIAEAVRQLQVVLNADPDTQLSAQGPGSPGNETSFFGTITRAAVTRFQEKYATEILQPLGLNEGTGFVGPATRAKLNALFSSTP